MLNIKRRDLVIVILVTLGILLVPLVAMQFTNEVAWTLSDFLIMGILIFSTGSLISLAIRNLGKYRVTAAIIIVILFLWLWVELAVGLFTNWGS